MSKSAAVAFWHANRFPIVLFAVLRVWTLVWASACAQFVQFSVEATKHYYGVEPLRDVLFAPWQRWDTIWYTKIALEGYAADVRVVFPPLYPFLLRVLTPLTGGNVIAAGLLLSSAAALVCFILLYQLVAEMYDVRAAKRAVLFFGLFPTAFYLFAVYTDALFLACMLGSFWFMRRGRWGSAGILGACAAMTRAQGVFILLPFAVEFWMQYRQQKISWRAGWALGLIALGSLAHLLWLTIQFGSLDVWFNAQVVWHRTLLPWETMAQVWNAMSNAPSSIEAILSAVQAGMEILLLGALVWSARRLPWSYTAYLAILAIPPLFLVTTYSSQFPLTAVARYALIAFPLFILLGALRQGRWQLPVMAFSFVLQTFWFMLFVAWVFVH